MPCQDINWNHWNGASVPLPPGSSHILHWRVQFKSICCHIRDLWGQMGLADFSNSAQRKLRLEAGGLGHDQLFLRPLKTRVYSLSIQDHECLWHFPSPQGFSDLLVHKLFVHKMMSQRRHQCSTVSWRSQRQTKITALSNVFLHSQNHFWTVSISQMWT